MTRGRKPKPTTVKLLAGNPGHRALNEAEPTPPSGVPDCPAHLNDEARAEWFRTCALLKEMNLLSKADRAALAAYCVTYSRWVEAEQMVKKYGMIVKSPVKEFPMKSPYLCIAEGAMEQMRRLLVEFGLTPSSRTRVKAAEGGPGSRLEEFLERRHG